MFRVEIIRTALPCKVKTQFLSQRHTDGCTTADQTQNLNINNYLSPDRSISVEYRIWKKKLYSTVQL